LCAKNFFFFGVPLTVLVLMVRRCCDKQAAIDWMVSQ